MQSTIEQSLFVRGTEMFKSNKLREALVIFEDLIDTNPEHIQAYFYLGNIFHMKGQIGKAIRAFNKVLSLDPNHTDASISLSVLLNDIGKYEEAKKIYDEADKNVKINTTGITDNHINKKFSLKHFEIAELYLTYNRFEEAIFEYNKAIGLDPEHLELRIKLAKVYAKKGFIAKAFEELKKLKRENPGYSEARVALGLLYYGNGNILEAQNEWQAALYKDPANTEIKMYLELSRSASETNPRLN